jgi:hypothetical protein
MKESFDLLHAQIDQMTTMLADLRTQLCDLENQYNQEQYIFIPDHKDADEFVVVGNKIHHHPSTPVASIKKLL